MRAALLPSFLAVLALSALLAGCADNAHGSSASSATSGTSASSHPSTDGILGPEPRVGTAAAPPLESGQAEAIFAGGCFWCMEGPFEAIDGVVSVTSGYTGGAEEHPSYEDVGSGRTGHVESVRVVYDPARVGYARLVEVFFRNIDPTQDDGQFCDRGAQYRSAIFVHDAEERRIAEEERARVAARLHDPVVTEVRDASPFWVAEDYHQDFYRTHPERYTSYRTGCGRDRRLEALWGDEAGGGATHH